jgi:hypothetical protein
MVPTKSCLLPTNHQERLILPHIQLRSSRQPGNSTIIPQKSQIPIRQSIHRIRINLTLIFHCPLITLIISTHSIPFHLSFSSTYSRSPITPQEHTRLLDIVDKVVISFNRGGILPKSPAEFSVIGVIAEIYLVPGVA